MSPTRFNAESRKKPRGFTLTELMVVVTIIGVLAAMSVPSFQRAMEQSRVDIAAANLRCIWAAERLYWLEFQTYTADLSVLQACKLLDPSLTGSSNGFDYTVATATSGCSATATRSGSTYWSGSLSISTDGEVSGAVNASGQSSVTPGYQ
jgi:prepilin-type N-terminal cleavage/methylation domain-containing protein